MGERVAFNGSEIKEVHGVDGTCVGSASTLYANSKKVVIKGDDVSESDGGTGSVTEGNDDNVFFNGVSVSRIGSYVQMEYSDFNGDNYNSMIESGSDNVYIGVSKDGGLDDLSGKKNAIDDQLSPIPPIVEAGEGTIHEVETRSWRDNWGWRTATDGGDPIEQYYVYQGEWCEIAGSPNQSASAGTCWGNHKGFILFPEFLRNECLGKSILSIEMYLIRNDVQGYYHKQPLFVYTHNYTSLHPEEPTVGEPVIDNYGGELYGNDGTGWEINEEKWATLPSDYNTLLSNGEMTGVAFYRAERDYYMHFQKNIKVKVTFG